MVLSRLKPGFLKTYISLSLIFIFLSGCKPDNQTGTKQAGIEQNISQETVNQIEVLNFRIRITSFYFGHDHYIVTATPDSITTAGDIPNGVKTIKSRALTGDETKTLKRFLGAFPLQKLRDSYINTSVRDGKTVKYSIAINDNQKDIIAANYYQRDLGELTGLITGILKEDYIGYNKSQIPEWPEP